MKWRPTKALGVLLVVGMGACGRPVTAPVCVRYQTDTVVVRGPEGQTWALVLSHRCVAETRR